MKLKEPPRWGFPAGGSWSGLVLAYPVAASRGCPLPTRAALTGENAGMQACRSSRSYRADPSVTWSPFLLALTTVKMQRSVGQRIFPGAVRARGWHRR
jgi:hypothetical protein